MKVLASISLKPLTSLVLAALVAGCGTIGQPNKVEPVTFNHPDEIILGAGATEGYGVLADRRVFAVMAFLNAVGYDEEVRGAKMHPIRVKVRAQVAQNLTAYPEKLKAWKRYYRHGHMASWQYANWALSLCPDYPFRRVRPNKELGYSWTAWKLRGFPAVLNDFWRMAKLEEVWADCRSDYMAEIQRYRVEVIAAQMNGLWEYLRMRRPDNYTIIQLPNPLQRHNSASGNSFSPYYYSIDGPGSNSLGLNDHEYLHTFVNPLMRTNYPAQRKKLYRYFKGGKDAPLSASYQDPVGWSGECLIHALSHRLGVRSVTDPSHKAMIEANVTALSRAGYPLLQALYNQLPGYEKSTLPFDQYLPILLKNLPEYEKTPRSNRGN